MLIGVAWPARWKRASEWVAKLWRAFYMALLMSKKTDDDQCDLFVTLQREDDGLAVVNA